VARTITAFSQTGQSHISVAAPRPDAAAMRNAEQLRPFLRHDNWDSFDVARKAQDEASA
jgi:hypothetical protein